jgi:hypothetical protein
MDAEQEPPRSGHIFFLVIKSAESRILGKHRSDEIGHSAISEAWHRVETRIVHFLATAIAVDQADHGLDSTESTPLIFSASIEVQ